MTIKPKKTKENSHYIPIKQVYFDAILDGSKDKEYRSISPNTVRIYIENEKVGDDLQLLCNFDLISEENFDKIYTIF